VTLNHQTCDRCERVQRFEFSVSDDLWSLAGCQPHEVLCIECFCRRLEDSHVRPVEIEGDVLFLAMVGTDWSFILKDNGADADKK